MRVVLAEHLPSDCLSRVIISYHRRESDLNVISITKPKFPSFQIPPIYVNVAVKSVIQKKK